MADIRLLKLLLVWSITVVACMVVKDEMKELKDLVNKMKRSTEVTVKMLEEENTNGTLCISMSAMNNGGRKHSPRHFYSYISSLDQLHKYSLGLSHSFVQPRVMNKISSDINLIKHVGKKMKKYVRLPAYMKEKRLRRTFRKISCKSKRLFHGSPPKSMHHTYLKHFRNLLKVSKSLFKRFVNTD